MRRPRGLSGLYSQPGKPNPTRRLLVVELEQRRGFRIMVEVEEAGRSKTLTFQLPTERGDAVLLKLFDVIATEVAHHGTNPRITGGRR
jgi:hypothetical protein